MLFLLILTRLFRGYHRRTGELQNTRNLYILFKTRVMREIWKRASVERDMRPVYCADHRPSGVCSCVRRVEGRL